MLTQAKRAGSRVRRLVMRVARRAIRPVASRIRLFLTAELIGEMADLRAKQDLVLAHLEARKVAATDAPAFKLDGGVAPVLSRQLLARARADGMREAGGRPDAARC